MSLFPKLSEAKVEERIYTGLDLTNLLIDPLSLETMGEKEIEA